jgi:hypothetical protein
MKQREKQVLYDRIAPPQAIKELDESKLQELLEEHYPKEAADPLWVKQVRNAIHDAHFRSSIAHTHLHRASDADVQSQLVRIVASSDELLEALSGASARRQQKRIADRIWFFLHSFWTLLHGPSRDGDSWERDLRTSSELDRTFFLLRRLNQRSRRILRRLERADFGQQLVRFGNKADHYVDSLVMCLGRCPPLGGAPGKMSDRQEIFITEYLKAAGSKHTTRASVRSRWNRVKAKDTEPWTEPDQDGGVQNTHNSREI